MSDWYENNNHYLGVSLQWLRLKLQRLIEEGGELLDPSTPAADPSTPAAPRVEGSPRFARWRKASTGKERRLLSPGSPPSLDEQIRAAAEARDQAAGVDPKPALLMLSERFGLSAFERDTLFLCAAIEFDPALAVLISRCQGHPSRNYATFGLALSAFEDASWDALSAHRPLRFARLIEINRPAATPLTASALRADERIVNFIKGLNLPDDRLSSLFQLCPQSNDGLLSESQESTVKEILDRLSQSATQSTLPIVQLVGADQGTRIAVSQAISAALNRRLYRLMTEWLPAQSGEIEILSRLWQRESLLLPVALYVDVEDAPAVPNDASRALRQFLSSGIGIGFIGVNETPIGLGTASFTVDVSKPTSIEQCAAWEKLLNPPADDAAPNRLPQLLAGQFNFSLSDIREAVSTANSTAPEESSDRIWEVCRNITRPRLDSLAQRLESKATWDDLVLPVEQMNLMRQIAGQVRERHKVYDSWGFARVMNRGFGISALFAGESGTGKTMAAEVIANDLKLNLYRIDLSAVVSKYIGETEKNLARLFDAAERGGAILFFDEADALFGKRSEVKDSHDRYANIEINYLLQRMEAFSGLAILATNMKAALDQAFMRRLRFIVNLPFPGVKERMAIWQKALPAETPKKDLDYERLARLNLSGGNIHSIALNAAFLAAQNGQVVTMPVLIAAARGELRKLEKAFSEAEFR
jgi:ATPase family associated with various cellular activities (AAA)